MKNDLSIKLISPTVFLARKDKDLQQLTKLKIYNKGSQKSGTILVKINESVTDLPLMRIPEGESIHEIFINEVTKQTDIEFILKCEDGIADRKIVSWQPPKHWKVHVVQLSHHDPGYTDLPSRVLEQHDQWLNDAIDYAEETQDFPEDAKFRVIIEQAWSIDHFLKNTSAERAEKIIELMRSGQFELTALFGNMTSELCGHETMARTLYHAFRLKRKYGIPIQSAEHADVTGISWGLSRVLTDAGIKFFCPGIPLYYNWNKLGLQSFWEEKAIFPKGGPGAFWWEAPSGKRILFWCNNSGCGGDFHINMPMLAPRLQELNDANYPYSTMRWQVIGGERDNSPYNKGYAYEIKAWNEKWAYPHLVCSTNAKFYEDFSKEIPADLPIFRGELAGQDYPIGATSTAEATAVNRNNHSSLISAEKLSVAACTMTDYKYESDLLFKTQEDVLFYDEHAWGFHFPCGPAMKASEYEKALHAYRASAFINEFSRKALARIADNIKTESDEIHLVVFNSTQYSKTDVINTPLREIENCGSTMTYVQPQDDFAGVGYLKGVFLTDRNVIHPSKDIIEGKFILLDCTSGEKIPFQIVAIESQNETVPYAPQRLGIGSGGDRLGYFDCPTGLKRDLSFVAKSVPAYGYKTYKMIPVETASVYETKLKAEKDYIENEFYKISVNFMEGSITSIFDKVAKRELVDVNCPHGFNNLVVRTPERKEQFHATSINTQLKLQGPVCASIEITSTIYGHPAIKQTIKLFDGIKQINLATRILKDPTPLLDVHLAFPFLMSKPKFRYEGSLSVMDPITDYLPGSYSDTIAVQNWVKITDGSYNILWSSMDAPMIGLSGLQPGYVSPAHRCIIDAGAKHPPLTVEELDKGWIYSNVFNNNFGTNFSVSQTGDLLFRYILTTGEGELSDSKAAEFGWQAVTPFEQVFTQKSGKGSLPLFGSFVETDNCNVAVINCKKAEDNNGLILRLWNMSENPEHVTINLNYINICQVSLVNLAEEDMNTKITHKGNSFTYIVEKNTIANIRIL